MEGETYSLTCDLMGDESLEVAVMFVWERPSSDMNVSQDAIPLTFEPLNCTDDGDYTCTANNQLPISRSYDSSQQDRNSHDQL